MTFHIFRQIISLRNHDLGNIFLPSYLMNKAERKDKTFREKEFIEVDRMCTGYRGQLDLQLTTLK